MSKELLFSVTAKDFEMETFRAGGKGGQHQNVTDSGVRLRHKDSGAVGEARDSRSQPQNKKAAFRRLLETPEWKNWYRKRTWEAINKADFEKTIALQVERELQPDRIRVEVKDDRGRWVEE